HYVTSKGGIMAFTRALARELGEHGIRVNTLAPGFTLSDTVVSDNPGHVKTARERAVQSRSIKRDEHPQDLLGALVFLASAESKGPGPKHNIEAMREAYYERIAKHDMTPLWKVMKNVVTKEPVTRCRPVIWHYSDIKRLVMESGPLISAEEAERCVLILENP